MFCKNCGKQNDIDSNFCVICGSKIENPNIYNQSTTSNMQNINTSIRDNNKVLLIIGIIVGVIILYGGFNILNGVSGGKVLIGLNEQEKKMIQYMNDKYTGKNFINDKRTKGYCPDDTVYDECAMHVYEKSSPNHVFQVAIKPSTGEITYSGYAKYVVENELAPNAVENAFESYGFPISFNIEFYQISGGNMFDDSSLVNFIKKHNPKSWTIWMTITVDDENLITKDLLTEAFTKLYPKLSGVVSFSVNLKLKDGIIQSAFEGEVSQSGVKFHDVKKNIE